VEDVLKRSSFCLSLFAGVLLAWPAVVVAQESAPASQATVATPTTAITNAPSYRYAALPIGVSKGVDPKTAKLLDELFLAQLSKYAGKHTVLGYSDFGTMLDHEQQKSMSGCEDDSCIAEIGLALGVDRLIAVSMGKLGEHYLLVLKVIDPRAARVLKRESLSVDGKEAALADAVGRLAALTFDAKNDASKGEEAVGTSTDGDDGEGMSVLGFAGIGLSAVGAVALIASGTAIAYSEIMLNDPDSDGDEGKATALTLYPLGLIGVGVAAAVLVAGGVSLALGM
jgi:hypothetical protein